MMTDDEIMQVATSGNSGTIGFARDIIAAHTAKLRQGVELPEPFGTIKTPNDIDGHIEYNDAYTRDQILAYGDIRERAGYLRGLENAKRVCVDLAIEYEDEEISVIWVKEAIEKLKGGE